MMEPYSALVWRPMMRIWCLDPPMRLLRYGDDPDCRTRDLAVVVCAQKEDTVCSLPPVSWLVVDEAL